MNEAIQAGTGLEEPRAGDGGFQGGVRFEKFKAVAEDRKQLAAMIKSLQPKSSNRQIAKTLGAGRKTIDRDLGPNDPTGSKKSSKTKGGGGPNGPLSGSEAARVVARAERVFRQQMSFFLISFALLLFFL